MQHEPRDFTVRDLVDAWRGKDLSRNDEYQRGAQWTLQQKQGLIDSIFRRYPLPPLFLHRIVRRAPMTNEEKTRFEVVDGQQRILALVGYVEEKFALLHPTDRKLRLPASMRSRPAPWGGLRFNGLPDDLRKAFEETPVRAYVLDVAENDDEVRDLFIRLQAGTALGRQQIRDAWPGKVGPFINRLAGKMESEPASGLFATIDLRGQRETEEGERDEYVADRQTCAQLLQIFLARESDYLAAPSVSAGDLDALYHENPDFAEKGHASKRFMECLDHAEKTLRAAIELRRTKGDKGKKQKFRKLEVFALVNLFQDLTRNPLFKVTKTGLMKLAERIVSAERLNEPVGKISSGRTIATYYEWWRSHVVVDPGVRLDDRRLFSAEQKAAIRLRDEGRCQLCDTAVETDDDEEYDHHPIPYRDGGPTEIENGRLVHKGCHPRGRPKLED